LTQEEAKQKIFDVIKDENEKEIVNFINKYKSIKQEEAKNQAAIIISQVLPRVAID
jgi:hypothetical protein